ncbi:YciI family protein [Acidisoma silvae]|uniref:YciI family protein n=1 Tax=Acidisoma silvae TaxID=2802396 RepID=A0A963YPJ8_9PROT|nr:YciI family protein [Acidisoma silvae]MCB8873905.1 YciI family protein [Acidisoma silvae]
MLFAINNLDKPDSFALRAATRDTHLAYLDGFVSQLVIAGPLLNAEGKSIGSLIVIEAESQAAAEAIAAQDPYAAAGLFQIVTVTPYRAVYKDRQRVG